MLRHPAIPVLHIHAIIHALKQIIKLRVTVFDERVRHADYGREQMTNRTRVARGRLASLRRSLARVQPAHQLTLANQRRNRRWRALIVILVAATHPWHRTAIREIQVRAAESTAHVHQLAQLRILIHVVRL